MESLQYETGKNLPQKKIISLKFEYSFEPKEIVEFALTFPYTVERYNSYIEKFQKEINITDDL